MKNIFYYILILSFFIKCSEQNLTENDKIIEDNRIIVNGIVYSNYSASTLDNLIVTIENDSLYSDTTDSNGVFNFLIESEGYYKLSIKDSSYFFFDSTLFISQDTAISIGLSPLSDEYFPLGVGNWWSYNYDYHPLACYYWDKWEEGNLIWEIIDEEKNGLWTNYIIEETVAGIEMDRSYDGDLDTTIINQKKRDYFLLQIK